MSAFCRILAGAAILAILTGCAGSSPADPPRIYTGVDAPAALRILRARFAAIHTFSAQCQLKLVDPNQQTVHLDGLLVQSEGQRLRLRAWKMGNAVFDLTLRPDGLWIKTADDPNHASKIIPAARKTSDLARQLLWFNGGFFTEPGIAEDSTTAATIVFRRNLSNGSTMYCEIDRPTVTPRRWWLIDNTGQWRFGLEMSDYRDFNGIAWPTHLAAKANAVDQEAAGDIDIQLTNLEFNGELGDHAFDPPPGAEKRP
jgi:hypothetical protein